MSAQKPQAPKQPAAAATTLAKASVPTLEDFIALHKDQLEAMKLPKVLWKVLHRKLFAPKFIQEEDVFELVHLESGGYNLKAKKPLRKNGDLYIIPHCAEGDDLSLYNLFKVAPQLVEYLAEMVDLDATTLSGIEDLKKLKEKAELIIKKVDEAKKERLDGVDDDMIEMVMEQAEVDRMRAEQALMEFRGDVVAAIADCLMTPQHKALEANMNKNLFSGQKNVQGQTFEYDKYEQEEQALQIAHKEYDKTKELIATLEEQIKNKTYEPTSPEQKQLQRVAHLYQALFKNHFVNVYYSMRPRAEDSPFHGKGVQPEEIIKTYYIMETMGSAIIGDQNPNAMLECFICMSSGNSSWSVLVPARDIKAGEVITRTPIRAIPCPLEFKW